MSDIPLWVSGSSSNLIWVTSSSGKNVTLILEVEAPLKRSLYFNTAYISSAKSGLVLINCVSIWLAILDATYFSNWFLSCYALKSWEFLTAFLSYIVEP